MDDIDALIAEAATQLAELQRRYEESLEIEQPERIQPLVKNMLENYRSALDYLAERILKAHGNAKAKGYYPIARSSTDFPTWFGTNLPGVAAARSDIERAIELRQPHHPGYDWLAHLNTLTVENKHRTLTPQVGYWEPRIELEGEHAARFSPGEIPPDPSTPKTSEWFVPSEGDAGKTLRAVVHVDWFFADPHLPVYTTLAHIQNELPRLIQEVRQIAGV